MKFKAEELRDIITESSMTLEDSSKTELVEREESAGKHDCTNVDVVFSHTVPDGSTKFYEFGYEQSYEEGIQSDYWEDEVECGEVEPYRFTVTRYRKVEEETA